MYRHNYLWSVLNRDRPLPICCHHRVDTTMDREMAGRTTGRIADRRNELNPSSFRFS
jgi:hypothetical protein